MKVCTQNQGLTIWFTGFSGAGKSTLSEALKSFFQDKMHRKTILLDGDKIRKGINNGLGFSKEDRAENIRRVAQMAKLFNEEGLIAIVSCISPYQCDRANARRIHEANGLKFYQAFIDCSLQECEKRDVKGLYKLARSGQIKKFTGINDPYEQPTNPQIRVTTGTEPLQQSLSKIIQFLSQNFLFTQVQHEHHDYVDYACDIDQLNLLQVFLQKWTEVPSFMNYDQILQSIYFKTYSAGNNKHFQPIPLFMLVSKEFKQRACKNQKVKIRFINQANRSTIAILENPKFQLFRFEQFSNKIFGVYSQKHPKIEQLKQKGEYILSGSNLIFKCIKIFFNDGLDYLRKDVSQLKSMIERSKSDCVFGFQLRNPLHNGHLFLLQNAKSALIQKGFKDPILLLHPCGGWVKDDDVPLSVRVKQHEQLLRNNPKFKDTKFLLAIWPSPMYYAGPLEVLWHIKSRQMLGISYMVVGRDPAGIKHPEQPNKDLYDPFDGQRVIEIARRLGFLKTIVIPFKVIAWNKIQQKLMEFQPTIKEEFEMISGSQMRNMARNNQEIPEWFMNNASWQILKDYYQQQASKN